MALQLYRGNSRVEWYPKKASTVFTEGNIVLLDASGQLDNATTTSDNHEGIALRTTASTDTDYATTDRMPILVPEQDTVFVADVGTGSATAANVGDFCDLAAAGTIDLTSGANRAVEVVGVLSATKVLVKLNSTKKNQPSV
jgi:hypothetical protein